MIELRAAKWFKTIDDRKKRLGGRITYAVGFRAPYAIFVHENLQARHTNGRAKFLESAIRDTAREVGLTIARHLKRGTLQQALLNGAQVVKNEAQKRTPVDTGFLKRSAYVALVSG